MRTIVSIFAVAAAVSAASFAAAQEDHGQMALPEACTKAPMPTGMDMGSIESMMGAMQGMQPHHREMMKGMMQTHDPMMQGMMAEDPDLAFACAMIPHHEAAISMAEVELKNGDAGPMKEMAQKIIDAQKQEIAELRQWIEEQDQ
jgi:uncharacterized protein (DUF305 family)